MADILETAKRVADHRCYDLVTGESGTGKGVLAHTPQHEPGAERPLYWLTAARSQLPDRE